MKKNLLLSAIVLVTMCLSAQEVTTLTFTAKQNNGTYQKLDSVIVTNLTREWTEVLCYPDTLLTLNKVGIADYVSSNGNVQLYKNVPNPFNGVTDFKLALKNQEKVELLMFDINGRKVAEYQNTLPEGEHVFRAMMNTPQTYLLSAVTKKGTLSIKMVNMGNTGSKCQIELVSSLPMSGQGLKNESVNEFESGDNMQYVGYATQNDGSKKVVITQSQVGSETIVFTFPDEYYTPEIAVATDSAVFAETTATLYGSYEVNHTKVVAAGFAYKKAKDADYTLVESKDIASPFAVDLSELKNGTHYVYKAFVRTSEDSVVYGEEKTFTTKKIKVELKVQTVSVGSIYNTLATVTSKLMSWDTVLVYGARVFNEELGFDTLCLSENLKDSIYAVKVTGLKEDARYFAQAYAKDAEGEVYGDIIPFSTQKGFECGGTIRDYEGNQYETTKIGAQCWMAEDLRSQYYADGKGIASFTEHHDDCIGDIVYYEWPSASRRFAEEQMDRNVGIQGACPDGWHIPSYRDFNTMFKTIDPDWEDVNEPSSTLYTSHNRLAVKLAKPACWVGDPTVNTPSYYVVDTTDFNASGFSARPTGYEGASFVCPGTAHYWTSCGSPSAKSEVLKIAATNSGAQFQRSNSSDRYCVRCVMDE